MPRINGFVRFCAAVLGVSMLVGMIAAIAREGAKEFDWHVVLLSTILIYAALEGVDPIDNRTEDEIDAARAARKGRERIAAGFMDGTWNGDSPPSAREREPVSVDRRTD